MSFKKDARYYYDEIQKLLDMYRGDGGQTQWGYVCRDLFNINNPVVSEEDLKNECADYNGQKTENAAWTFSLYIMAWLLYDLKMKTHWNSFPICQTHRGFCLSALSNFRRLLKSDISSIVNL